ncbi:MAG: hypothetical protein ACJAYE_003511 [Candidatus Azotimanducaceae bacterium]|jgi:hypothetical protein
MTVLKIGLMLAVAFGFVQGALAAELPGKNPIAAYASSASRYPVPFLSDLRLFSSCCCSVDIFVNSIIVNMSPMAINMKIAIA